MNTKTKIYFASDFHLGVPSYEKSLEREKVIVKWLEEIRVDAKEIFLVGDIFDYWYEYKFVIPKGFIRLQGKIAEIVDSGTPVHFFTGNHDMWMNDYFPKELGVTVNHEPIQREFDGKKFYIGHGDGLGPGDWSYKLQKFFFTNKFIQWCFSRLHPNFASYVASSVSKKSRINTGSKDSIFNGEDKEWLFAYCQEVLAKEHFDFFIFGHRHLPLDLKPGENSRYINLGEWINYKTYGVWDGNTFELKKY